MKKLMALFMLILLLVVGVFAQNDVQEEAVIKQTVLDYAEGFYSGDVARMERAIHPDLNKAFPRLLNQTRHIVPTYTTYSQLIENTRAKVGVLADSARHLSVQIINQDEIVANVKVISANFNDYLQMIKVDDQWKIVNVLWNGGPAAAARIQGFNPEAERTDIKNMARLYIDGICGADAKRLELAADADYNRITIANAPQTGKPFIQRARYKGLSENAFARLGKLDETVRDDNMAILDIMDGLALVRIDMPVSYEVVQMYKNEAGWKILNSLGRQKNNLSLTELVPVTAGEPMPDFTLPIFGGGEFTLSKHKGKNVLLMFPRGWLGRVWCPYCPYQYLELAELEKKQQIRKKYNLEIVFVLPYSSDRISDWFDKMPDALQTVETTKHPANEQNLPKLQQEYAAWARSHFPKTFQVNKGEIIGVLPVLVDVDRTLSKRLKIFTNFWDGVTSEQNIASIFIIDKNGALKFKYLGQMTEDRPSVDFILDMIKKM